MLETYEDFITCIFSVNCIVIVDNFFVSFPFLDECVHDVSASVVCNKQGKVSCIKIRRRTVTTWVITPNSWGYEGEDLLDFIGELRNVYEHFGIGVWPTPSSLGYNLMLISWGDNGLSRHTKPNGFASEFIRKHRVGGRCDTPGLGERYDSASLYDLSSAYCAYFSTQPTGTSIGFRRDTIGLKTWFARCEIRVPNELALGPFPVRENTARGNIRYPTSPGTYEAYLWDGQVNDAIDAGCSVSVKGGFGWREVTNDTMFWCRDIFLKRVTAELTNDRPLISYTKRATVAAIGRHGGGNVFYTLVPEEQASDKEVHVSYNGNSYAYFVHEEVITNSANMIHWNTFTVNETSRSLYKFALPYAERGMLVATNYDGVITTETSNVNGMPVKYTLDQIACRPGTWLWCLLTNLYVKAPRTFISDQMTVTPGITRK